jgi:hypothetical protein
MQDGEKKIISKYFSELAKENHKKKPRSKEFYSEMGKKGAEKRWKKTVDNS